MINEEVNFRTVNDRICKKSAGVNIFFSATILIYVWNICISMYGKEEKLILQPFFVVVVVVGAAAP